MRRRSRAEADRLVSEFVQSGLGRKEFSAAHGLSVHTLDAWRRGIAGYCEEIVPVEIVENRATRLGSMGAKSIAPSGQLRVVLACGLHIEVEPCFDAAELRRLIVTLDSVPLHNGLRRAV